MQWTRREALRNLASFFLASPLLQGQSGLPEQDPLLDPINVFDFRKLAKEKLDPIAWDYMDEGGKDELSLRENRKAFDRIIIRPRWLTDVHKIDLTTKLLGYTLKYPIYVCPAGGKNCFYPNGEKETAKGVIEADTLMMTNGGIDELVSSGKGPKVCWQYTIGGQLRTKQTMLNFVERLEDAGYNGICFTVDNMLVSHRERSIHNKFVRTWCNEGGVPRDAQGKVLYKASDVDKIWRTGIYPSRPFPTATWETVKQLRDMTDMDIVIKGVLTGEDTELCVQTGMSAVVVSNHGARQIDHTGATIEALPECVQGAGGKIPVLIDGGFRRGTDVLKALALGATAVGIARPYLWGLTCFGHRGVARVLELLRVELALDMGMSGAAKISDIDRKLVRIRNWSG
jgi:isopentenyl diphosphate isomerase/L-lactate dehydrogenase-like FMN-dependent dehydrogenase